MLARATDFTVLQLHAGFAKPATLVRVQLAPEEFCSRVTQALDEPRAGTAAAGVRWWVMIEYAGVWGSKFVKHSDLPEQVRNHLAHVMDTVDGCRVQLIRRERPPAAGEPLTIYVADVQDTQPQLFRLTWPEPTTLDQLDLVGLLQDPTQLAAHRCQETVFFVCTNGQRDRCCAKFGLALFRALAAIDPARVWQTTHIGGHRFAPTFVSLPDGYCYGHVESDQAAAVFAAYASNRVYKLPAIRGRVCYDQPAQAAEVALRQQLGWEHLSGLHWLGTVPERTGYRVRYETPGGHQVSLWSHRVEQPGRRPKSCVDAPTSLRPWAVELPWSLVSREERACCAHLAYRHLGTPAGLQAFVELLHTRVAELPRSTNWDLGYEVNLYRDHLHLYAPNTDKHGWPSKRTFDFCLRAPGVVVIVEAKAQQGFTTDQLDSIDLDRTLVRQLLGSSVQVVCVALTSSRYTMHNTTQDHFDAVIHWSQLAELFAHDPVLLRADAIYRD